MIRGGTASTVYLSRKDSPGPALQLGRERAPAPMPPHRKEKALPLGEYPPLRVCSLTVPDCAQVSVGVI